MEHCMLSMHKGWRMGSQSQESCGLLQLWDNQDEYRRVLRKKYEDAQK